MKTVNLEELDEKTSQWLRDAARYDQVVVTEHGQPIATIQPARLASPTRKFSERKLLPGFKALMESGKLRGGTDSTIIISEDRDRSIE